MSYFYNKIFLFNTTWLIITNVVKYYSIDLVYNGEWCVPTAFSTRLWTPLYRQVGIGAYGVVNGSCPTECIIQVYAHIRCLRGSCQETSVLDVT